MTLATSPMTLTAGASDRAGTRSITLTWLIAAGALAVWAVSLSRSLFDPIWLDQAYFRYIVERAIAGDVLYRDVWHQDGPGVLLAHWLSMVLIGHSDMALRIFDALWQGATLLALAMLVGRDGGRWSAGWIAAALYAMAYYGTGYADTADRDGFNVLPLLLMVHGVIAGTATGRAHRTRFAACALAGVMGLFVFSLKTPFGACYGLLWSWVAFRAWAERDQRRAHLVSLAGLTVGFLIALGAATLALMRLGAWEYCWPIVLRVDDVPVYVAGHWKMLGLAPQLVAGVGLASLVLAWTMLHSHRAMASSKGRMLAEWVWLVVVAAVILGLLLAVVFWPRWRAAVMRIMGLGIPALGAVLVCAWHGRSMTSRAVLLLACGALAGILLQGSFNMYAFHPLMACAAFFAAGEIVERCRRFHIEPQAGRVWLAVCLACLAHLTVVHWGRRMTASTHSPYVLAGTTLHGYYNRMTEEKEHVPTYETIVEVGRRVRELTAADEPIAMLFGDPRIHLYAARPAAHRLVWLHPAYAYMFDEFLNTLAEHRPPVVLARVPAAVRGSGDLATVEQAVFADVTRELGDGVGQLRDLYHVTEIIDDVCILQPDSEAALPGTG